MLSSIEYDRMSLDVRELLMIHEAKRELGTSNYIYCQQVSTEMLSLLEKYGIERGK